MTKVRTYMAMYDDGHDYGDFEFTSVYRANSTANLSDAYDAAKSKYGYRRAGQINIFNTELMPE